jgi:hypothetical protein
MDQNNPNSGSSGGSNSGFGSGTTGSGTSTGVGSGMNSGSGMSGGSGLNSGGSGSGGTSSSMGGSSTNMGGSGGFGVTSASESSTGTGTCPHCGQSMNRNTGLEQFLGRLGINEDMIDNLRTQFQNVDIDEYLNTARDYLKDGSTKASTFAKENPGKVAAGVAALALGAGLIFASTRDK